MYQLKTKKAKYKALAALAEDLGSILTTHMAAHNDL